MGAGSANMMAGQQSQQPQNLNQINNFQQMNAQRQAELMAQRAAAVAAANRGGQFGGPNVGGMAQNQGPQGPAPPYRQNPNMNPGMNPTGKPLMPTQAQQQQQQFQQQQRLRQQQLLMQQQGNLARSFEILIKKWFKKQNN